MTEYEWSAIRAKCVEWFDDTPSKSTELTIINAFTVNPTGVIRALQTVAGLVASGECRSGWALALHRVERLSGPEAVATDDSQERDVVHRWRAWIRNELRHYERDVMVEELDARLLGASSELRADLLAYWEQLHAAEDT